MFRNLHLSRLNSQRMTQLFMWRLSFPTKSLLSGYVLYDASNLRPIVRYELFFSGILIFYEIFCTLFSFSSFHLKSSPQMQRDFFLLLYAPRCRASLLRLVGHLDKYNDTMTQIVVVISFTLLYCFHCV